MVLSTIITGAEEGGFIAYDPETGTTTQGETLANLREATAHYLEGFPHPGKGAAMITSFELGDAKFR